MRTDIGSRDSGALASSARRFWMRLGALVLCGAVLLIEGGLPGALASDHGQTFVNVRGRDKIPPAVIATSPVNGATGASTGTTVTVTFSETVKNVTTTTFRLSAGATPVSGTVTLSETTATFIPSIPSAPLAYSTTYTATVTTGVTDLAGNPLPNNYSWIFTTTPAPNTAPVANAGPDQNVTTGSLVTLDGSASFDADGDPLTYVWSFSAKPAGSTAALSSATAVRPTFTADLAGAYVLSLVVSDGSLSSLADTVTITAATVATADCTDRMTPGQAIAISGTTGTTVSSESPPELAANGKGLAIAVWEQNGGTSGQPDVWSSLCIPGQGWSAPTRISDGTGPATAARVAMDDNGTAIALWRQWDGTQYSVYANRYTPESGWGAATVIETGAGEVRGPQVAMDTTGNAIAVWPQWDGATWSIFANRYEPGTGWGTEAVIETGPDEASHPLVAMDAAGRAMVIWDYWSYPSSSYSGRLYFNVYEPGTGWATETRLDPGLGNATNARVAMDGAGNAVAVWVQTNGNVTGSSIYVRRYEPGAGWGDGTRLEEVTGGTFLVLPQVAINPTGVAAVVWAEGIANWWYETSGIYAGIYVPGTGWAARAMLSPGGWYADSPDVAIDHNGDVVSVWRHKNTFTIYANRYTAPTGWGTAAAVETESGNAYLPKVALERDGDALVIWSQFDGTGYYVAATRYSWR